MAYHSKQPTLLQQALRSHIVQGLLVVFILFMVFQVFEQYQTTSQTGDRRVTAETEYQDLLEERSALAEQVDELQNDHGIEAEIRRNFDVARDGEEVVIILEDTMNAVPSRERASSSYAESVTPTPWYRFWE